MEKLHKGQTAKALVLSIFFLILPFMSSSMKSSYLYFLLNLVILVLAMDAGVLSSNQNPIEEKKNNKINTNTNTKTITNTNLTNSCVTVPRKSPLPVVQKSLVQVAPKVITKLQKLKRCASRPSIFFIGGGDDEVQQKVVVKAKYYFDDDDDIDDGSKELSARADMFIGNFYKQLKMQREQQKSI